MKVADTYFFFSGFQWA
ncbi:hypothetical protein N499_0977A, partial [Wolbachia pipientis wVitA]